VRKLVIVLALFAAYLAPWRLIALGAQSIYMRPGLVHTAAGTDHYWDAKDLENRLRRFGWSVAYDKGLIENSGAYGMTQFFERKITVDDSLSWNERYAVLLHEAGHTQQPYRLTTGQGEVFAESVSALAGTGGLREHARYLAGLKADVLPVLLIHWSDIYRAADNLRE
jgi:hypothetical protein